MEAATVAPRTERELAVRLKEVQRGITRGEGDVGAMLEERERLQREMQAARIKRETAATAARKGQIADKRADYLARVDLRATEVLGDLIPRLLLALPELRELEHEAMTVGLGHGVSVENVLGVPSGFADGLLKAIHRLAPNTEWDFSACSPLGLPPQRPRVKVEAPVRLHAMRTDIFGNFIRE